MRPEIFEKLNNHIINNSIINIDAIDINQLNLTADELKQAKLFRPGLIRKAKQAIKERDYATVKIDLEAAVAATAAALKVKGMPIKRIPKYILEIVEDKLLAMASKEVSGG